MNKNIFVKLGKKIFVGIIPIIFVAVFLCAKPVVKNIFVESSKYREPVTPPNSAFTDMEFYKCVVDEYNYGKDQEDRVDYSTSLTDEQLASIKKLECGGMCYSSSGTCLDEDFFENESIEHENYIYNIDGVEKLTNLMHFSLNDMPISSADLSHNTKLTNLNLSGPRFLTDLTLSDNCLLESVYISGTLLTSLDLSNCSNLETLTARNNELTDIDLSGDINLDYLNLSSNELTGINLTTNTKINRIVAYSNKLADIDLSNNVDLEYLDLSDNELTSINLTNNTKLKKLAIAYNKLDGIDLSTNVDLEYIDLGKYRNGNESRQTLTISSTNRVGTLNLSHNNKLKKVYAKNSGVTDFNININAPLEELDLEGNNLDTLDVSNISSLKELYLNYNRITSLDVSHNLLLESLFLQGNLLTNIDLSKNTELLSLSLYGNQFTDIDLSHNTKLSYLNMESNSLTGIDLTNNINLEELEMYNSGISSINLTNNTKIKNLDLGTCNSWSCGQNRIESIDLSNNVDLEKLRLDNQSLTTIDLSHNAKLTEVSIDDNKLSSINLDNCSKLETLSLIGNSLSSINLDDSVLLKYLYLSNNRLTSIDLSHNVGLYKLLLNSNRLTSLDLSNNTELSDYYLDISDNNFGVDTYYVYKKWNNFSNHDSVKMPENINTRWISITPDGICEVTNYGSCNFDGAGVHDAVINYQYSNDNEFSTNAKIYVVDATSNKYTINVDSTVLYTGADSDDEAILSNISIPEYDGLVGIIEDNTYIIKHENQVIREFTLINISSDKYDLHKNYLEGDPDDILSNIDALNCSASYNEDTDKFEIKRGKTLYQEIDHVSYSSNKYDLSGDSIDINDNNIESLLSNINCTNCSVYVYDGTNNKTAGEFSDNQTLRIMHDDELVKELLLNSAVNGINIVEENLSLSNHSNRSLNIEFNPSYASNKNVTWSSSNSNVANVDNGVVTAVGLGDTIITVTTEDGEYTDTCTVTVKDVDKHRLTYRDGDWTYSHDYEEGSTVELKSDYTRQGYIFKGWKDPNNQEYTDKFTMPDLDVELTAILELAKPAIQNNDYNLVNDDSNDMGVLTGINLGTDVENLDLRISSIYDYHVYNNKDVEKTSGNLGTGDKIKFYLNTDNDVFVTEYIVSVLGDMNGDGEVSSTDFYELYKLRKKLSSNQIVEHVYKLAGDTNNDGSISSSDFYNIYKLRKKNNNSSVY